MKKIKQMKVALFLFSFLSVIVFMSVSSLALPDVPKKSSNTSGNMANNGRVLKYDGWVYYSFDESGLYRMKEDGRLKLNFQATVFKSFDKLFIASMTN